MFLYLGGVWMPPMVVWPPVHLYSPHTFVHPLYIHMPPGGVHPHGPSCSLASAWFWSIACCGGVVFLLNVYWDTPPLFEDASPLITPPHSIVGSLYIVILRDISLMWAFPLLLKGLGVFPHHLGRFGGTSALQLFTCSFLYIFL